MFMLLCELVGFMVVIYFPVMFSSSNDDRPTDTPAPRRPFSKLASMAQQLRSLVPLLGRAVQAALVRMLSFLSRFGSGGKARLGKFNFGVGTGW